MKELLLILVYILLQLLAAEFTKDAAPALCAAVTRHLQEAEQARLAGNVNWYVTFGSSSVIYVQGMTLNCIHILNVTGSFLY